MFLFWDKLSENGAVWSEDKLFKNDKFIVCYLYVHGQKVERRVKKMIPISL